MPPHAVLPTVAILGVAGLTGVALALAGHHASRQAHEGTASPPDAPENHPIEVGALVTALLGGLAKALTLAASAQQLYSTHVMRQRRSEDRLDANAVDAVRAAAGEYTRPLKEKRSPPSLRPNRLSEMALSDACPNYSTTPVCSPATAWP